MAISYSRALGGAWRRMGNFLFRPFDLGRWFVVGFTAWLATFLESDSGSGVFQAMLDRDEWDSGDAWSGQAADTVEQVMAEAWLLALVGSLVVLGILVGLVMMWLGSRGQFMLLDNLVHRRAEVGRPWREFAAQGDSLFLWQLVYSVLVVVLVAVPAVIAGLWAAGLVAMDAEWLTLPFFIVAGVIGFTVIVTLVYIEFFLLHLIVPIMYRYRCGATTAWGHFHKAFSQQPGHLVLFGLLHLGFTMVATAVLLVVGMMTCCVGMVLMMIPYIGAVVTLPVPTFRRYLDLEFLAMLDPDWNLLDDGDGSGQLEGDGAVVRTEDVGPDPGGPEPGPENF